MRHEPLAVAARVPAVLGQFLRKKLQCNMSAKIRILGLVNHTHPSAAEFFEDAVVRDGLANHRQKLAQS
jgi:hypothetical protein